MQVRTFNRRGIARARTFLEDWRESGSYSKAALQQFLLDSRFSSPFDPVLEVERASIGTRRDAASILVPLFEEIERPVADDDGLWSWLGLLFAPEFPPSRNITTGAYVFLEDDTTPESRRAYQRRYRHALRASYLIRRQHSEAAAFLLDQPISSFSDLEDRLLSDFRAFSSIGVVQLAIELYTDVSSLKPDYSRSAGGLRHLLRVLTQLERTHDVYGMEAEALLQILPAAFDHWKPPTPIAYTVWT